MVPPFQRDRFNAHPYGTRMVHAPYDNDSGCPVNQREPSAVLCTLALPIIIFMQHAVRSVSAETIGLLCN